MTERDGPDDGRPATFRDTLAVAAFRRLWAGQLLSILGDQGGRNREIRLSFSYVTPAQIEEGIARLARFVRDTVGASAAA